MVFIHLGNPALEFAAVGQEPPKGSLESNSPEKEGAEKEGPEKEGYEWIFPAMGTTVALQTFHEDKEHVEKVFNEVKIEVDRLESIFSDYDPDSEASLLSTFSGDGNWHSVSPEMWDVLQESDRWNRLSQGKFDASLGKLTSLWRMARRNKTIPAAENIQAAIALTGWKHVELDADRKSIRVNLSGLKLDFGAIAKGYIVDQAFDVLAKNGMKQSLVRAGGDMHCGDPPPGKEGWKIEIGKIDASETEPTQFLVSNVGVATSGDLFQFMVIDGVRRSHVIDVSNGYGVPGPTQATVIAKNSMEADSAATSFCILGHEAGIKLADSIEGIEVRIVSRPSDTDPPKVSSSRMFEKRLENHNQKH